MPKKTDAKVEGMVLGLSEAGLTQRSIVSRLKQKGIAISQRSVSNIVNNNGKRRQAKAKGLSSPVKVQPAKVVNPGIVRRIDVLTSKENPPSQRELSRRVGVSLSTVHASTSNNQELEEETGSKNKGS